VLLDTSAIIEIFRNPIESSVVEKIMSELENEDTYVSIVQLAEVADWAARNKVPPRDRINVVKELARTVPLDEPICLDAAVIKRERRKAGHTSLDW
jgi:predicted nucleic acid-binding protein